MGRVQDKAVILTGAGSGIGRAIARRFAEEGARLFLVGRDENKLRDTSVGLGDRVEIFAASIANEQEVDTFRKFFQERSDRLDILINNAGTVLRNETMTETSSWVWDEFMQINLKGPGDRD